MPTHRLYGFGDNPLDYKELNEFGKKNNIKFIIKMHPFVAEQIREDLAKHQKEDYKFTNLIVYPANMDIYPILKYSDMLLADYSSVYFDYLFLDKPIVFFPYDFEKWVKSEKGTRIDYFKYSPGDKYYNVNELFEGILKNFKQDKYKNQRKKILDEMFENQNEPSSKLLMQHIDKLMSD
jgi:CDP-glycerol glycerophosphotransferase (TagB/SpsB family)